MPIDSNEFYLLHSIPYAEVYHRLKNSQDARVVVIVGRDLTLGVKLSRLWLDIPPTLALPFT
jgi:hypothetical protein